MIFRLILTTNISSFYSVINLEKNLGTILGTISFFRIGLQKHDSLKIGIMIFLSHDSLVNGVILALEIDS